LSSSKQVIELKERVENLSVIISHIYDVLKMNNVPHLYVLTEKDIQEFTKGDESHAV
jgi:hypothetical protein